MRQEKRFGNCYVHLVSDEVPPWRKRDNTGRILCEICKDYFMAGEVPSGWAIIYSRLTWLCSLECIEIFVAKNGKIEK